MRFRDVEVMRDEFGRPVPTLHGRAAEVAEERGVVEMHLSLSFTHSTAVASAVAITAEHRPRPKEVPADPMEELAADFKEARSMLDGIGEDPDTTSGDEPAVEGDTPSITHARPRTESRRVEGRDSRIDRSRNAPGRGARHLRRPHARRAHGARRVSGCRGDLARVPSGDITVVAGRGNNGGDGWVAARVLCEAGRAVSVVTPVEPEALDGIARDAARAATGAGAEAAIIDGPLDSGMLDGSSAIIDALFGVGFVGPVREPFDTWVDAINACGIRRQCRHAFGRRDGLR